ncbi:MAG: GNAT family N-acetyltransferase [Terriglobales bacterium]
MVAILETPRLILREFTPEDADALSRVISDPETMRYYPAPYDRAGVEQWIARNRERYKEDGVGLWAMEFKIRASDARIPGSAENEAGDTRVGAPSTGAQGRSPHELIGDCGLIRQKLDGEHLYEIGYHLRRDCWGQGFATEAARACRDWGFTELKADLLISLIRPENLPSRRVAERNGMTIWKDVIWHGMTHLVYSVHRVSSSNSDL